jgi:hypothetical protein
MIYHLRRQRECESPKKIFPKSAFNSGQNSCRLMGATKNERSVD